MKLDIIAHLIKQIVIFTCSVCLSMSIMLMSGKASGMDLSDIKKRGVLRHLGVFYANFVTGSGDGTMLLS